MAETRKLRVFLSYTHTDIDPVRKLYYDLSDKGFEVWFDEESLIPGQEWKSEIERALENSDAVVVCLSSNSVSKEGFVQKEFKFALDKALEMTEDGIFLIPVRLHECKVPLKLSRYHWVDLFVDNGFNRLMKALSLRLSQVATREKTFQRVNLEANTLTPGQDVKEKNSIENPKEITPEIIREKPVKSPPKIESKHDERRTDDKKITSAQSVLQEKELDPITISKWRSTFSPLWLTIPAGIVFVFIQKANPFDPFGVQGISISISLSIVSISFFQWNLLRKYFSKPLRWVGLNIAYIIFSLTIDLWLSTYINKSLSGDIYLYYTLLYRSFSIFFFAIFLLWLVLNNITGNLIVRKDARIARFFSGKTEK